MLRKIYLLVFKKNWRKTGEGHNLHNAVNNGLAIDRKIQSASAKCRNVRLWCQVVFQAPFHKKTIQQKWCVIFALFIMHIVDNSQPFHNSSWDRTLNIGHSPLHILFMLLQFSIFRFCQHSQSLTNDTKNRKKLKLIFSCHYTA